MRPQQGLTLEVSLVLQFRSGLVWQHVEPLLSAVKSTSEQMCLA